MSKGSEDAKKMIELTGKNDPNLVGSPIKVHAVQDYISELDMPYMARYGTFHFVVTNEKTGEDEDKYVDRWRGGIIPEVKGKIFKIQGAQQTADLLMHFPEFKNKNYNAKLATLFKRVYRVQMEHARFSTSDQQRIAALWTLSSHFFKVFSTFPILKIQKAGFNQGGTAALNTLLPFCPRPTMFFNATPAAIYRYTHDIAPTVGYDENTYKGDEETRQAMGSIIDGAWQNGNFIPRTARNGIVEGFDAYGPRILTDTQAVFSEYGSESRAISLTMAHEPNARPPDHREIISNNHGLIQALYDGYVNYATRVRRKYLDHELTPGGRVNQVFRPLLAVALILEDEGIKGIVDVLIREVHRQFSYLNDIKTEADPMKRLFGSVLGVFQADPERLGWFHRTKDGTGWYIRTTDLKKVITTDLSSQYQNDRGSGTGKRYWERVDKDVQPLLENGFNNILRTHMAEFCTTDSTKHMVLQYTDINHNELENRLKRLSGVSGDISDMELTWKVTWTPDAVKRGRNNNNNNYHVSNTDIQPILRFFDVAAESMSLSSGKGDIEKRPHNTDAAGDSSAVYVSNHVTSMSLMSQKKKDTGNQGGDSSAAYVSNHVSPYVNDHVSRNDTSEAAFVVVKDFWDAGIKYTAGQKYRWNAQDPDIRRWIERGKIEENLEVKKKED